MNAAGAGHMFWQAPPSPFSANGRLRTIPLRMGGRPVLTGGFFMAQAPGNRLYGVSIPAIIGRIQIQPVVQAYVESVKHPKPPAPGQQQPFMEQSYSGKPQPPNFPPMSEAERQILLEIAQNPTDEELKDLATIDSVFNRQFESNSTPEGQIQGYVTTMDVCYLLNQPPASLRQWGAGGTHPAAIYFRRGKEGEANLPDPGLPGLMYYFVPDANPMNEWGFLTGYQKPKPGDSSFQKDAFYCTDTKSTGSGTPLSSMFGIDPKKTWGEIKQAVENAQIIVGVHDKFPFPPPVDLRPDLFWTYAHEELPKMANIAGRVDPEAIRAWMTLTTLQYYPQISDQIQQEAAAAARRARRRGWIIAIFSLIGAVVAPFVLPAILVAAVSAIKTIITTILDIKQRQAAARALADSSKLFEKDAPAFAAELQKTADMMDSATAQEEASKPLTPEQQAAIQDVAQTVPSTPVGTYVVGGVAATGAIVALVALLR